MIRKTFLIFFIPGLALSAYGQKKPYYNAPYDMSYYVAGEDGHNGLSVTYNPDAVLYYCVFAGNSTFPLEVFTTSGENVYRTEAGQDMRGLWYNPSTKKLEGILYNYGGFFSIDLKDGLYPGLPDVKSFDFQQPTAQSTAVFNAKKKEIFSYYNGEISIFAASTLKKKKTIGLKGCPVSWESVNPYSMIYTGYKNYEFGLYDFSNGKVHLFNTKGTCTHSITLPHEIPYVEVFCFAFANDRVWLFDTAERVWHAYWAFYYTK